MNSQDIYEYLKRSPGMVSTQTLSDAFQVVESCIRKHLRPLRESGDVEMEKIEHRHYFRIVGKLDVDLVKPRTYEFKPLKSKHIPSRLSNRPDGDDYLQHKSKF